MKQSLGIALVTGGSRGIGRSIGVRLANDGYHVILTYQTQEGAARQAVAEIESIGGRATLQQCDIRDGSSIQRLFERISALKEPLRVLVGNAAAFVPERVEDFSEATFTDIMNANIRAPLLLAQAAAPHLEDGASMVFLSSIAAHHASPTHILYSMSKAALEAMVRALAADWGPRGIRINCIRPGLTETEMADQLCAVLPPKTRENVMQSTALGRLGTPNDIAQTVSFLAGQDSGWITGQTLDCTGGYRL